MQSLGKVLERLHTAWDHLNTAQGIMRFWYEPMHTRRAWERWRDASPPGSIQLLQPTGSQGPVTDSTREQYYRFWMAKPWRWRIEQFDTEDSTSSLAKPQQVMVIDGGVYWSWSAGSAVHTNAQTVLPSQTRHPGVDSGLLVMLDPAPLAGTLRLRLAERTEAERTVEIGRRGDVVLGTVRDQQQHPGLWPGADQYRLLVEREHGILLRAEALLAEHVFAATTFTDLTLDQDVPDERFTFQPPEGVSVRNM